MTSDKINQIVRRLHDNHDAQTPYESDDAELPNIFEVRLAVDHLRYALFPELNYDETRQAVKTNLDAAYKILLEEVVLAIARGDEFRDASLDDRKVEAAKLLDQYFEKLPDILNVLKTDVEAIYQGDPAAYSHKEIIISYLSFQAILIYRLAKGLRELNIPLIPRIMTEYGHMKTGVDINPGAEIGECFFIDHGTGVVIGETAVIGRNVKIYQGVTLGALSLEKGRQLIGVKRHPTIEDNVVIYANAAILGGNTVIGESCVIGGGTFVTKSVEPHTQVALDMKTFPIRKIAKKPKNVENDDVK